VQSTIIIVWDILPWLWDLSGRWLEHAGYGTDYEERHGFNKMTLGLFFMDMLKGFLIAGVIGLPILALVLQIIRLSGDNFYFYVWIFMIIFNLVLLTIYPTLIQPLFNKVEPLEEGELRERIEELAS
ncbi:17439_t:CDS:2, partial [Racocetra persica]